MEAFAPQKPARTCTGPRKRTGCIGCKQRHVKCDETTPACTRCVRANTSCIYPDTAPSKHTRRRRDPSQVLFREPLTQISVLPFSPATTRQTNDTGNHVLRYFHERTIPLISHFVPAPFWTETVLQMSEANPAIKHCILALGSWHLTIEKRRPTVVSAVASPSDNVLQFSVASYNKAISNLVKDISVQTPSSSPIEVALTASVLLAIHASLRGERSQVVTHVRLGLNLARQSEASSSLASVVECSRRQLAFLRLGEELRAPIFDSLSMSTEDTLADVLTGSGGSLDASSLDALAANVQNTSNAVYRFARRCNVGFYADKPSTLASDRERLETRCNDLRVLMTTSHSHNDALHFKILQARLELSWIILQAGWTLEQIYFDQYMSSFEFILQLAGDVLRPAGLQPKRLPFSVDLGLIPLLFYVSRLCRHPVLRRKAVELLGDCPVVEGLWNARETAAVARFVIALEESGGEDCLTTGVYNIREENRVHALRFGPSATDDATTPQSELLDVTVMMQPEGASPGLQDLHFRIFIEEFGAHVQYPNSYRLASSR